MLPTRLKPRRISLVHFSTRRGCYEQCYVRGALSICNSVLQVGSRRISLTDACFVRGLLLFMLKLRFASCSARNTYDADRPWHGKSSSELGLPHSAYDGCIEDTQKPARGTDLTTNTASTVTTRSQR